MECMEVCDVYKFYTFNNSQLLKHIFFVQKPLWNSDNQKFSNFKIDLFITFCSKIIFTTVVFSSHSSMQNIGFYNSGYDNQTSATKLCYLQHIIPLFTNLRLLPCTVLEY